MARIRTIKPGFFRSHDVTLLSYRARLTWIGLWTYVDDDGRGRDDARIIKGDLWPLEDDVTWQDVEDDLTELSLKAHVIRYTVDGRNFLAIPKWLDHQVISRPSKSKFPEPTPANIREVSPITESSVKTHGANTAGSGTGNREREVEQEGELSLIATEITPDPLHSFDDFWATWPRSEGKADAKKAWEKATRKTSPDVIFAAAEVYATSPYRPAKQFVPHGATWLNAERWNDPPPEPPEVERRRLTRTEENLAFVRQLAAEQESQMRGIEA